jgi:23S rRNA (adenine2503-C2)-methyltransferase
MENALPDIRNMTIEEIEEFISGLGKQKYRARQLMKWVYQAGATDFSSMTDLSKDFRTELAQRARISRIEIEEVQSSRDGTRKILFRLEDGEFIESVIIPGRNDRTLCVSTQAGCRMGCKFCLTGKAPFRRNLLPAEITGQIIEAKFRVPEGREIDNIVLMGMGEPLDNYDNVLKAIRIMTAEFGPAISPRKITLSTCGLPDRIIRLGLDIPVNLAISLNAPDDATRSEIMPVNRKHGLAELIRACRDYSMPKRRRITFEYILMAGVNDSRQSAEKLAKLLRGVRCKLNLIAFNEYPGAPFMTPSAEAVEEFRNVLIRHGYTAILRKSKGSDILAACGQLSGKKSAEQTKHK